MSEQAPLLSLNSLSREIKKRKILDNISFDFLAGKTYTIIGPSGAGKSSLLRLINRLDEPTDGTVLLNGKPAREYKPEHLRCQIGFLFQTPHLFEKTISDNLLFANRSLSIDEQKHLLEIVQINASRLHEPVPKLSVGEKQRVALARLLATKPLVALLDEPTSALDPSITEAIEQTIKEIINLTNLTVIMVTHNPDQALRMGGESLLLVDGKLIETGHVEHVINNPSTQLGRQYRSRDLL